MSLAPPRRKSKAVFWIATIAIGSIILATALLANDMRNLRAIAARYHLALFDRPSAPPPATVAAPSPPAAPPAVKPPQAALPKPPVTRAAATPAKPKSTVAATKAPPTSHLFDPPVDALVGTFLRNWRISGKTLCAELVRAGLPVGEWRPSAVDRETYECSYESQPTGSDQADAASFFLIARGAPTGEISSIRIKVIIPNNDEGRAVGEKFIDTVVLLLTDSRWLDFEAALDGIGKLQNVSQEAFGARLTFSHEYQDDRRFNFILELTRKTSEQIRTATVFDRDRWTLPSPPPSAK